MGFSSIRERGKMKFDTSIDLFIASVKFVLFVNSVNALLSARENYNLTGPDEQLTAEELLKREIDAFPKGLKMMNDRGELVELTIDHVHRREAVLSSVANQVSFYLYTRQNPYKPEKLVIDSRGPFPNTRLSRGKLTVFITHGWVGSVNSLSCTLIRKAYLENNDVNVIVVDWSPISLLNYYDSATQVPNVAQQVANMINHLNTYRLVFPQTTTLVGHSLGAHVMGIAGTRTRGTINQIVGLDPAAPMFNFGGKGSRISQSDATYVQIIHTNAGLLGIWEPLGDSDFYPNSGTLQPGCEAQDLAKFGSCSHDRAFQYFAESLNPNRQFIAQQCRSNDDYHFGSCVRSRLTRGYMGGHTVYLKGIYLLRTKGKSPYALFNRRRGKKKQ